MEYYYKLCNINWNAMSVLPFQLMRKNPEKHLGSSERDAEHMKKQAFFKVSINRKYSIENILIGANRLVPLYLKYLAVAKDLYTVVPLLKDTRQKDTSLIRAEIFDRK